MHLRKTAVFALFSAVLVLASHSAAQAEGLSFDPERAAELGASLSEPSMAEKPGMAVPAEAAIPYDGKPHYLGISHSGDPFDIPDFSLEEVARMTKGNGGAYYRPHIPLKEALPVIDAQHLARLEAAQENPQEMQALIDELAENGNWARIDGMINTFVSAGLKLIVVAGCGYQKEAPSILNKDGKPLKVSPGRMGRSLYLAMLKWYVGAAVRRYGDRVKVWQVENEINTSVTHAVAGWRLKDSAWLDRNYQISMLAGLSDVVHQQGARLGYDLKTTQNYSTAIVGWEKYIRDSARYVDIVGIDLYANYFFGWPRADKAQADNVLKARAASGGKPVWILEAGFADGPKQHLFSPQTQALYFKGLIDRAFKNGAEVILVFGWFWNPAGWYTDSAKPAPWYAGNAAEAHWSPLSRDPKTGEIRYGPAWDVFGDAAKKWCSN
ncbi:MAG: hypothetical protein GX410_05295 [Elusimicrobia bacterium]|nr:hypothetical protein [Elusimicrobiota bacterium]